MIVAAQPQSSRKALNNSSMAAGTCLLFLQFAPDYTAQNLTLRVWILSGIMATFEPSLSTSGMRPPLSSADAPSMADSLPSINFGFEELRNRMNQFTAKFDAFIEKGRKQVLEERNQFHINLAELQGMSHLYLLLPYRVHSDTGRRGPAHETARR